ncbi:hypothetical protein NP233_g13108 [Leucocoprinus birnbaumii]|uniref:Uncharacterized protein n=1 Tax=Leucocoprinus birnbaumii TaxID=56174 RepID=A0AAD5YPB0_9AGAR|nr:hypothetical protein NP233_g13108 [Leucocoprinus birnbaumii]
MAQPALNPPFVNFQSLEDNDLLDNCRVRMICSFLEYDERTAKVKTTDEKEITIIFLEKLPERFRIIADYYLLEGITKDKGAFLLVEKEPRPLLFPRTFEGKEDKIKKLVALGKVKTVWGVIDEMTQFMHERAWRISSGIVPPEPRFVPIVRFALASPVDELIDEEEDEPAM